MPHLPGLVPLLALAFLAGLLVMALVVFVPRGPTGWCIRRLRLGDRVIETHTHVRVRHAAEVEGEEPAGG